MIGYVELAMGAKQGIAHHFTGKERDTESGNDYFGARYYSSSMGRWLSPDWSKTPQPVPYSELDNPQSLNLYSYVGNNPLLRADADGHFWRELWNFLTTGCDCWIANRADAELRAHSNYMAGEARAHAMQGHILVDQVFWFGPSGLAAAAGEGGAAGAAEAGAGATEAGTGWVRVGRWMSREELEKMQETGYAQEGPEGGSKVAEPADMNAYKAAPAGDVYVEYDVPAGSTGGPGSGGSPGWSKIPGPNSIEGRLAQSKGLPTPEMPPVRNIQVIGSK